MIVPAIAVLTGLAAYVQHRRKKVAADPAVQSQRRVIYETAINDCRDPEKLRALATAFRQQNMPVEADMLEKRALLREMTPQQKEARKEALRKALECTDPQKVMMFADAFASQGCIGAATRLREYAEGLISAQEAARPETQAEPAVIDEANQ